MNSLIRMALLKIKAKLHNMHPMLIGLISGTLIIIFVTLIGLIPSGADGHPPVLIFINGILNLMVAALIFGALALIATILYEIGKGIKKLL